jgi:hypothetical protein
MATELQEENRRLRAANAEVKALLADAAGRLRNTCSSDSNGAALSGGFRTRPGPLT